MVPANSTGISPVPAYSGYPHPIRTSPLRDSHPLRSAFPYGSGLVRIGPARVLLPRTCRDMHGLGCSASARRYSRNHCCFLFLRVLRCFSSPGSPPLRDSRKREGCPIRTPADQLVCADPRGFSQLAASFVASESLGIPRAPLSTCNPRGARAPRVVPRPKAGAFSVAILAQHFKEHYPDFSAKEECTTYHCCNSLLIINQY